MNTSNKARKILVEKFNTELVIDSEEKLRLGTVNVTELVIDSEEKLRLCTVNIFETNDLKVGKNLPVNRLRLISGLIKYE